MSKCRVIDKKGAIKNKEWRIESNINKKIIQPTQKIATCQKTIDELLQQNEMYQSYINGIRDFS